MIWSLKTLFESGWLGMVVGLVHGMAPTDRRTPVWLAVPAGTTGALLGDLVAWLLPVSLPWWTVPAIVGLCAGLGVLLARTVYRRVRQAG